MSDQSLLLLFMISTGLNLILAGYGSMHKRIKRADEALYRAKQEGRDRVITAQEEP